MLPEITKKGNASYNISGIIPRTIDECMQLATILSKSGIVPREMSGKPESVFLAISLGMEVGLPPVQALNSIMIVNGRPSIWGDALKALIMGKTTPVYDENGIFIGDKNVCEEFDEDSPDIALKQGYGRCCVKRIGRKPKEVRFSLEDAKKAGLWGKPGPWQQYPGRMLMFRARSWACRDEFPDILRGIQVREEVEDFQVKKPLQMPQEIKTVEPVVVETPADRIAKARTAFAEKYQATDEEMDALISRLIAESDGNLSKEELPDALTGLWNDLRQGKADPNTVFNRIGAKEKKK